jgi:hypothetical protein
MLNRQLPVEASKTANEHALLEKLTTFYEDQISLRPGSGFMRLNPDEEFVAAHLNLLNPLNLAIGPLLGQTGSEPPESAGTNGFCAGEHVVILRNDTVPSLVGILGRVASPEELLTNPPN